MARWRRSGIEARAFAAREDLSPSTLMWWSSELGRATRAQHGSTAIEPIEIAVPASSTRGGVGPVEIAVGGVVVRCEVGADVSYVASLVSALRGT